LMRPKAEGALSKSGKTPIKWRKPTGLSPTTDGRAKRDNGLKVTREE